MRSVAGGLHLTGVPAVVVAILGLIGLLAAAVAVARTSYMKASLAEAAGRIAGLQGDRDDLKERLERVEIAQRQDALRADTAEARVKILEGIVTGAEQLASISSLLAAHDRKAERLASDILKVADETLKAVKAS